MIPLFRHNIGDEDINRCINVLRSNWHTAGPISEEVEGLIEEYYGHSVTKKYHTALTSNCTAGLLAVALAIGLKSGDEVLVPAMTFTATAASVMHYGAQPVFIDIDHKTGLIDIDKIEEKITDNTKAIYTVNLYGHIPDIKKIKEIADKYGLFLLEDCAHAFDSKRDKLPPATFSDVAVYSFYATKTMHCGEGGAVISQNHELIKQVKTIIRHGLSKYPSTKTPGNIGYDVICLGFKGVISDIQSSLLINQIKKADEYRAMREAIALKYYNRLKTLNHIYPLMPNGNVDSSWYTFPTRISSSYDRRNLMNKLAEHNIGHTIMYQSLESFSVYDTGISCPVAFDFGNKQLSLPCYPALTVSEQDEIITTIEEWHSCI